MRPQCCVIVRPGTTAAMEASSESARPDKTLCADFKRTSTANVKEIVSEVSNNVELQLIVLRCIQNYKRSTSGGTTLGQSVQLAQGSRKAKKEMDDDHELTAFFKNDLLGRGRFLYKNWGIEMYRMLFRHMAPWFTKVLSAKITDPERFRELMDWLFKKKVSRVNSDFDRVMSTSKKEVFDYFRDEYAKLDDPLLALWDDLENGFINWPLVGFYGKQIEMDGEKVTAVIITAKHLNGLTARIPEDVLNGDDGWETTTLEANWNTDVAYLKTQEHEYNLKSLFPVLCRMKRGSSANNLATPKKTAKVEVKNEGDTGGTDVEGRLVQPVSYSPINEAEGEGEGEAHGAEPGEE